MPAYLRQAVDATGLKVAVARVVGHGGGPALGEALLDDGVHVVGHRGELVLVQSEVRQLVALGRLPTVIGVLGCGGGGGGGGVWVFVAARSVVVDPLGPRDGVCVIEPAALRSNRIDRPTNRSKPRLLTYTHKPIRTS
jgi:hypothetical protein